MSHSPQGVAVLTAVLTRPADTTAYTANDLVARQTAVVPVNSPAIVNAVAMKGDAFRLDRVRLRKSSISLTSASFRVHFFDRLPTWTVGDNGAGGAIGALAVTDMAGHCGFVEGWTWSLGRRNIELTMSVSNSIYSTLDVQWEDYNPLTHHYES